MAEQYRDECGVNCEVVYPSRGEDSPIPKIRMQRVPSDPLVVAYAGMIHQHWAKLALAAVAKQLAAVNGQLDLYVPYTAERLAEWGISGPNIRLVGFFPAHEMADRVASSAHALLLPASFSPEERRDASTLFPSKLADYTGIGLPVLVWGPEYSSAARWVRENPEAAVLVTDADPAALAAPLLRLKSDPSYAHRLAQGAVSAGMRYFDPDIVRSKFLASLRRPSLPPRL
jgi:glycosyltransferase involved in cell wall biosynthesis